VHEPIPGRVPRHAHRAQPPREPPLDVPGQLRAQKPEALESFQHLYPRFQALLLVLLDRLKRLLELGLAREGHNVPAYEAVELARPATPLALGRQI
jgi:hypothetical protein